MGIIENRDAQFMLLAGFIIAVGLVITTLLLSSIVFEGSMAGEVGSDPIKYDIVNLMQISRDEMRSAYRNATTNGGGVAGFSNEMRDFSRNISKIYALRGEGVNVSWDASNWISTPPLYPNFTKNGTAGGATNWTVIENVSNSNITVFVIAQGNFYINITNTSKNWAIPLVVGNNLINNAMISNNISSPYSINFFNGAGASGNYSINGTASGRSFIRARDYILNATLTLSTSRVRANITIPVSVPW